MGIEVDILTRGTGPCVSHTTLHTAANCEFMYGYGFDLKFKQQEKIST